MDGERESRASASAAAASEEAAVEVGDGGEEAGVRERREAGEEGTPYANWRCQSGGSEVRGLGRVAGARALRMRGRRGRHSDPGGNGSSGLRV